MNNEKENWEKRFDKKFARRNMSTGEFENKWFIKDTIRAKDIKLFIRQLLEETIESIGLLENHFTGLGGEYNKGRSDGRDEAIIEIDKQKTEIIKNL